MNRLNILVLAPKSIRNLISNGLEIREQIRAQVIRDILYLLIHQGFVKDF